MRRVLYGVAFLTCMNGAGCVVGEAEESPPPEPDTAIGSTEAPQAARVAGEVIATPIRTEVRMHSVDEDYDATTQRRLPSDGVRQFRSAGVHASRRGESVRAIDAQWIADLSAADTDHVEQRWRLIRELESGAWRTPISPSTFVLRQPADGGELNSCASVTGIPGRRAILLVRMEADPRGESVAELLFDGVDQVAAFLPAGEGGGFALHGGQVVTDLELAREVSSW